MSEKQIPLSADEAAFIQRVADAYDPPPLSPALRARFDARLDVLVAEDLPRSSPWLIALAAGAAVLALAIWQAERDAAQEALGGAAASATAANATSPEEAILATATVPVADADEALPVEYRAISDLLVGD